jgi:hypothetical protein
VIAAVQASDLDSPKSGNHSPTSSIVSNYLAYFIKDGNDGGHFKVFYYNICLKAAVLIMILANLQINERGEISIWRQLDYEQEQKYELRIVATDGHYTDYANVSINLLDVNGKCWRFRQYIGVEIIEYFGSLQTILQFALGQNTKPNYQNLYQLARTC